MSFDDLARILELLETESTKKYFYVFCKLLFIFLLPKIICASCFLWKYFLNRTTQLEGVSPILLYNSTINGLNNDVFHACCDHQGPTMTIFTLNGRIVVGMLFKSWNVSNYGWKTDPEMKLFLLNPDGSIVNLEPIHSESERYKQFYNGILSGPHFFGLPVDLRFSKTEVHFLQRELITGNERCYHASIDHIAVYSLGLKNFILTNTMKEPVFYSIIQSKLQKMNAASLLVSTIKLNHAIQALQKLKARSCIQSRLLRIKSMNVVKKLIAFDKEIQVATCGCCLEPLVSNTLKILPCGHVICDVCFPQIIFPFKCPHCRKDFQFAQCKNGEQIVSHFSGPSINTVFFYNNIPPPLS